MSYQDGIPELETMTWQEAARILGQRPIGLLPIGAIEAHGPHLPLDTDVIIATATARRAALRLMDLGIPAIVLPAISYSISFAGTSFAGTTPSDPTAFESYLVSVLTHLAPQGYQAILCCNAHLEPSHVTRTQMAARKAESRTGVPVRAPDQRSEQFARTLSEEFRAGARHAGAYETSIVLATRPEVVRQDVMIGLPPVWIDLPAQLRAGARTFAEAGADLGYFGDPASSSVAEGHRILNALAEMMIVTCRDAGIPLPAA